jgi:hypothetical protein
VTSICIRLDRVIVCSEASEDPSPPRIPGFRVRSDFCSRPGSTNRTYDRVRIFRSRTSGTEAYWQYRRRKAWLKPWRITVVGDEKRGLIREEAKRILRYCRDYKFVLVELALDFSPRTGVDQMFVKQHAVFGKSRRRWDRGGPDQLRFGTRRSGKLVRCYWKKEVDAYRVELELHSGLLRTRHVNQLDDLPKAAVAIFPRHLRFAEVSWTCLEQHLSRRYGSSTPEILLQAKRKSRGSLHSASRYLRRKGVRNVHRFFRLLSVNQLVENALHDWAKNF